MKRIRRLAAAWNEPKQTITVNVPAVDPKLAADALIKALQLHRQRTGRPPRLD